MFILVEEKLYIGNYKYIKKGVLLVYKMFIFMKKFYI